jgi:hypothetical protein
MAEAPADGFSRTVPLNISQDDDNYPQRLRNFLRLPPTNANDPDIERPSEPAA